MGVMTDPFIGGRGDSRAAERPSPKRATPGLCLPDRPRSKRARRLCRDLSQSAASRRSFDAALERVGGRLMAARRPPTAMRRWDPTTATSRIVRRRRRRRLSALAEYASLASRWPAAAPISASPMAGHRPLRPVPGRRVRPAQCRRGLYHRGAGLWLAGRHHRSHRDHRRHRPAAREFNANAFSVARRRLSFCDAVDGWLASRLMPPDS